MKTVSIVIVLIAPWSVLAAPTLWNDVSGPMPPNQPKEMGVETQNYQYYTLEATGEVILDLDVPGYQFNSYAQQCLMSTTGGEVNGVPQIQIAYNNFADPSSNTASMLAHYNTQTCMYGPIEGNSPYTGYDYYTNLLLSLYNSGVPVYFEYVTLADYGTCLQYTATPPWPTDDEPRVLTYTLTFQQSTGYLLIYALGGTEYCCPGANIYCPNSGNCPDGTAPQLTNANTTQYFTSYQIYSNTSWAEGFFGAYCPFESNSSNNKSVTIDTAMAILFAVLFFFAVLFGFGLTRKLVELRKELSLLRQSSAGKHSDNL